MRRFPIPLVLAAVITLSAITVILTLQVSQAPIVADANLSAPIPAGSVQLWKAAGFSQAAFTPNATITLYEGYGVSGFAVYAPQGLPANVTINRGLAGTPFNQIAIVVVPNYGTFMVVNLINTTNGATVYMAYMLSATTTSGLYLASPVNATLTNAVATAVTQKGLISGTVYGFTGVSYDTTTGNFLVGYVTSAGASGNIYVKPVSTFTVNATQTLSVTGGVISLNINGYPVAIEPFYTFAIQPGVSSGHVQVTINVH